VSKHLSILHNAFIPHPELFKYMPVGPFETESQFEEWYTGSILPDPTITFFYIEARPQQTDEWDTAGVISLLNSSMAHLKTEGGFITILPKWQRTFVQGNATGLLLQYCLNLPKEGGLGLRRVQWQASCINQKSLNAAKRLGFRFEGILRWDRCMPIHPIRGEADKKSVLPPREGDPRTDCEGRHTAVFGIGWDAWEGVKLGNDPDPWWMEGDKELPSVKERLRLTMARTA
jgi:RimJ/RimL family protein N-acetyltransferase